MFLFEGRVLLSNESRFREYFPFLDGMKRVSYYYNSSPASSGLSYLDLDRNPHSEAEQLGSKFAKTANVNREMVANFHPRQTESTLNGLYIPSITGMLSLLVLYMLLVCF